MSREGICSFSPPAVSFQRPPPKPLPFRGQVRENTGGARSWGPVERARVEGRGARAPSREDQRRVSFGSRHPRKGWVRPKQAGWEFRAKPTNIGGPVRQDMRNLQRTPLGIPLKVINGHENIPPHDLLFSAKGYGFGVF